MTAKFPSPKLCRLYVRGIYSTQDLLANFTLCVGRE